MRLGALLALGRVSNLPTVWSNVLAGTLLAAAEPRALSLAVTLSAGTLFYVGGMFLNDAFDAEIDARERPERPIPSGRAARGAVFAAGFGMLALGLATLALHALLDAVAGTASVLAGTATAFSVVVYDRWHKGIALAPLVMGACRAGLYVTAASVAAGTPTLYVAIGALSLALYVVGLTHVARFETRGVLGRLGPTLFVLTPTLVAGFAAVRASAAGNPTFALLWLVELGWVLFALRLAVRGGPGRIPRAVVSLIAGISLVDALFLATLGAGPELVLACFVAFLLTLAGQRWVRGT